MNNYSVLVVEHKFGFVGTLEDVLTAHNHLMCQGLEATVVNGLPSILAGYTLYRANNGTKYAQSVFQA